MSLQFISNSVLRGDASFSTGSAALFQSSGNNTTSDTWIYNSGSLANGYQLDFGHGIARTSTNIIMSLKGGNVGIGTTSPRGKLDIVGNTDNDTDFLTIQDNDTSAGSHRPSIRFRSDTAQIGQIVGLDNSMRFSVGTTETSLLEIASSGNIGIGTTGPTALLEVKKDNATIYDATSDSGQDNNTATVLVSNDNVTTNTFSQIAFHNKGSNRGISRIVSIGVGSASTDLAFVTENNNTKAEKMRITSAGNVGIGTTSPNYALDIEKDTGSLLNLYRPNSSTAAASFLDFSFNTANATEAVYARIRSDVEVNTNSAQGGDLSFHTANSGTVGAGSILLEVRLAM